MCSWVQRRCGLAILIVIATIVPASGQDLPAQGLDSPRRINTVSVALVGGVPLPMYGLSVFLPTDSTEESCWIITLSGYKEMWADPAVVLSGAIGWHIKLTPVLTIRPTFGLGDLGLVRPPQEAFAVFTVHLGLWVEAHVSRQLSIVANFDKRLDVTYRYYSPWGLGVGMRFHFK
jgi:hypothetical protein